MLSKFLFTIYYVLKCKQKKIWILSLGVLLLFLFLLSRVSCLVCVCSFISFFVCDVFSNGNGLTFKKIAIKHILELKSSLNQIDWLMLLWTKMQGNFHKTPFNQQSQSEIRHNADSCDISHLFHWYFVLLFVHFSFHQMDFYMVTTECDQHVNMIRLQKYIVIWWIVRDCRWWRFPLFLW